MVAILFLLTIVVFLLADWVLQLVQVRRGAAAGVPLTDMTGVTALSEMDTHGVGELYPYEPPNGLFFHPGHCWAQIERDGLCRVGVDELIGQLVGHVDEIYLPKAGTELKEGDTIATIRQGSRLLSLRSPMDGVVMEVNERLKPRHLKSRAYSDGWLFVIRPKSLEVETRKLLIGNDLTQWHKGEFQKISDFFSNVPRLANGLVFDTHTASPKLNSVLERAGETDWRRFQDTFLSGKS